MSDEFKSDLDYFDEYPSEDPWKRGDAEEIRKEIVTQNLYMALADYLDFATEDDILRLVDKLLGK